MAVKGPDFIALQVRDLDQAARFYETRLGLRRAATSPPGAVVFETSPIPFAVREPVSGVDLDSAVPGPGIGVALWLAADDPDDLHGELVDAGVTIPQPPSDGPFGRMFSLIDPDGYLLTIHGG